MRAQVNAPSMTCLIMQNWSYYINSFEDFYNRVAYNTELDYGNARIHLLFIKDS